MPLLGRQGPIHQRTHPVDERFSKAAIPETPSSFLLSRLCVSQMCVTSDSCCITGNTEVSGSRVECPYCRLHDNNAALAPPDYHVGSDSMRELFAKQRLVFLLHSDAISAPSC